VPVVPTWAVVPDPVLPSLADAPCVVSPELLSTAVALSPVVVLPPVNVDVALAEPLLASLSVVACDADSLADPPSVGAVVVAWEVVMVAPVASVASGPRLVEPALAEPPPLSPQADRTHQAVIVTTFRLLGIAIPSLSPPPIFRACATTSASLRRAPGAPRAPDSTGTGAQGPSIRDVQGRRCAVAAEHDLWRRRCAGPARRPTRATADLIKIALSAFVRRRASPPECQRFSAARGIDATGGVGARTAPRPRPRTADLLGG
jgi:hypothetical protein